MAAHPRDGLGQVVTYVVHDEMERLDRVIAMMKQTDRTITRSRFVYYPLMEAVSKAEKDLGIFLKPTHETRKRRRR